VSLGAGLIGIQTVFMLTTMPQVKRPCQRQWQWQSNNQEEFLFAVSSVSFVNGAEAPWV